MGRTKEINQAPADMPEILPAKSKALVLAQDEMAVILEKDANNVKVLAARLGYNGPLQPDALEQICVGKALAADRATFEFGASLLLLRESCLHGDWLERLQRIGCLPRTAQRYMQVALKFKYDTLTHLASLGQMKLLELVVLDDEEVAAFANGESVRGLTFADADRYSVKELRAKLRDKDQELQAAEKLAAELHSQKDKLDRKLHHRTVAVTDWPAEFKGLVDQVQFAHKTIKHNIGSLDVLREKAMSIVAASPEEESALDRAKEILAEELLVAHRSCAAYLEALGLSYEKTLGAFAKEGLYQ